MFKRILFIIVAVFSVSGNDAHSPMADIDMDIMPKTAMVALCDLKCIPRYPKPLQVAIQ